MCDFSVASRRYAGKDKEDETDWVRVSIWGPRAEALAKHLTKGTRVAVSGKMHVETWRSRTTGKHGASLLLRADDVELMGSPKDDKPAAPPPAASYDGFGGL